VELIVTGAQRSGTTIMQELINLHPWAKILTESHHPMRFDGMFDEEYREEFLREGYPSFWSMCNNHSGEVNRSVLVKSLCASVRSQWWWYRVFGDKSPAYCFHWKRVRALWPQCHIIAMVRDLDECAASIQKCWWGNDDIDICSRKVKEYNEALVGCPGLHVVSLDDLKRETGIVMAEILDWLSLPIEIYPLNKCIDIVSGPNINPPISENPYKVVADGKNS